MKRTPLRRTRMRPWRRKAEDRVTPAVANYVLARDNGCVGITLDLEGPCDGRLELDHVDNGGLGKRGPSTADNLVSLCSAHHFKKTNDARAIRPLLRGYLDRVEGT
ncbi:MAG: HNH endonuclease signature motif containing protein [Acidimicrobiales bacterium]